MTDRIEEGFDQRRPSKSWMPGRVEPLFHDLGELIRRHPRVRGHNEFQRSLHTRLGECFLIAFERGLERLLCFPPSFKTFLVGPLVGAFFVDLLNALATKFFIALPIMQQAPLPAS